MKYSNKILVELLILFFLATFALSFFYLAKIFVISGDSMRPALKNSERILLDKRAYNYVDPIKGDIIGMNDPHKRGEEYIKRIAAVPGDHLVVGYDEVKVNGIVIDKEKEESTVQDIIVPKDCFFVMGDNRPVSYDSRDFGLIHKRDILGRAVVVVWPFSSIRIIR